MEVNEKIIEEYLKLVKAWFYMSDILFTIQNGYSNIDLLAYDQINDTYYDIEVKYRSTKGIENADFDDHIYQMTRFERNAKIEEIIGNNKKIIKIFITTKTYFGKLKKNEEKLIDGMKKKNHILKVWYFDDIFPELYERVNKKGRYNTELTQTIRLLKTYMK